MQLLIAYGQHFEAVISRREVDYSSVHTIVRWIIQLLIDSHPVFSGITNAATSLSESIAVTSGHGMYEIWLDLLLPSSNIVLDALRDLNTSVTCLEARSAPSGECHYTLIRSLLTGVPSALRRNVYDLMAVLDLSQFKDDNQLEEISQLIVTITQRKSADNVEASTADVTCIAVNELSVLSNWVLTIDTQVCIPLYTQSNMHLTDTRLHRLLRSFFAWPLRAPDTRFSGSPPGSTHSGNLNQDRMVRCSD